MKTTRKYFNPNYISTIQDFGSKFMISGKGFNSTATSGLPRISISAQMNRSSSISFRNTKSKLEQLEEDLETIRNEVMTLSCQSKVIKQNILSVSQQLIHKSLPSLYSSLSQQIRKLSKNVKISQISNISRNDAIKTDIVELANNSKIIKLMLDQISQRMSIVQDTMGFYNAREKLKY